MPLSELLLADLSNPTPATLHHLQQLAYMATQKQGAALDLCPCISVVRKSLWLLTACLKSKTAAFSVCLKLSSVICSLAIGSIGEQSK